MINHKDNEAHFCSQHNLLAVFHKQLHNTLRKLCGRQKTCCIIL